MVWVSFGRDPRAERIGQCSQAVGLCRGKFMGARWESPAPGCGLKPVSHAGGGCNGEGAPQAEQDP